MSSRSPSPTDSTASSRIRKQTARALADSEAKTQRASRKFLKRQQAFEATTKAESEGNFDPSSNKKSNIESKKAKVTRLATEAKKVTAAEEKELEDLVFDVDNLEDLDNLQDEILTTEEGQFTSSLNILIEKRMTSIGSIVQLWPTINEWNEASTGVVIPPPRIPKDSPCAALFARTVDLIKLDKESAILSFAVVSPGSHLPSGCVFITRPVDSGTDSTIHDFYQVQSVPSNRLGLRKAVRIITSRGDPIAKGNSMDEIEISDILFSSFDLLCTLPEGGLDQVLLLTNLISWAPDEYFGTFDICEPFEKNPDPPSLKFAKSILPESDSTSEDDDTPPVIRHLAPIAMAPRPKFSSVPKLKNITVKYPKSSSMYEVPTQIINSSIVNGGKAARGENGLVEALKASTSAITTSLQKLGMSNHTLSVMSVAASEASKALLSEVRFRFLQRKYVPINLTVMKRFIQSWMIEQEGAGIKYFINLVEYCGASAAQFHGRKFLALDDSPESAIIFQNAVDQFDFYRYRNDIRVMEDAVNNILLN